MTTGMNFWDFNVWAFLLTISELLIAMIVAQILRNNIKLIKQTMIPSSVLGGFLLLLVHWLFKSAFGIEIYKTSTLEILTYHGLGLGFAALALRNTPKKTDGVSKTGAFDSGVTVVNGYLLQAVIGLLITIILYKAIGSFFASGIILPMGYGQGPGQAYNWGHTYEMQHGFEHGTSFGLAIAAMGFVSASVGGVICLNRMKKNGIFKGEIGQDAVEEYTVDTFTGKNEIPVTESMDKFTIQVALVFISYTLAYAVMIGLNKLLDPSGQGASGIAGTLQGMIWGFQFLFGTVCAILVKTILNALMKKGVIKRNYTNNFMQNRISGFMFDIMVVASIAAIDLSAFKNREFVIPLTLICIAGAVGTYFYLKFVCKRIFPWYEYEAFLSLYGMQTGTASTGAILLREIDPKYETQASDNMVYHMPWAILFGAPMFLMVGIAPRSLSNAVIVLLACVGLFAVFNVVLFRKQIFSKKKTK